MKWLQKEISELSDIELNKAHATLSGMLWNYKDKQGDPKYEKRFASRNPDLNPTFVEINNEINKERSKRGM